MSDGLRGGSWQRRGSVRVWVPATPAPPPPRVDVRLLIACPTCRAHVDQTCRTTGGNPTKPHSSRLAPRLCPCGARLAPRKQMCEPCRVEARRQTYRSRERRQPTSNRRAA